jgi:hypothetical protein
MRRVFAVLGVLISVSLLSSLVSYAQTVSIKSEQLSLGAAVWLPITINAAPDGLNRYTLSVSVDTPEIAHIEDVRFPEPLRDFANFQIAPDGNTVQISVRDENDVITRGAQQTTLAEVKLRGTFGGRTTVTLAVREIVNDRLIPFNVAISNGQLSVAAAPSAPTLVVGVDGVLVGDTVRVPLILTSTVGGVRSYRARVRLERRDIATFVGADFPFFADQQEVSITPDGDEIALAARDGGDAVQAGAKGVILAWLILRGDLPTMEGSPLRLLSNTITEDNNNSGPFPTKDGLLTVIRLENLPPAVLRAAAARPRDLGRSLSLHPDHDQRRQERSALRDDSAHPPRRSPDIAVWVAEPRRIVGSDKASFHGELKSDRGAVERRRARHYSGARPPGSRRALPVALHRSQGGRRHPNRRRRAETIEELLDTDGDNRLGDLEILRALDFWIKGRELAPGLSIDDLKMLALIDKWIKGAPLRASAARTPFTYPVPY